MRVEEVVTGIRLATKEGSPYERAIPEGVTGADLLPHRSLATRTCELAVEHLQGFGLGREFVYMSFNRLPNVRWVHFDERHQRSITCQEQ